MATLADSLVSSSARKLGIRKRPDLTARLHKYQGRAYWVVKEPVGLNYFRFQEEEFAILNMLDGTVSLDEIKERFEADFPPQKITVEELQQFIGMLHRSGLVITGAPGQGKQLKKRSDERGRKELMGKFTNLLAIRFKGVDPNRFLNSLYPWVRFCFRPWAVFTWFAMTLSALLLVLVQFDVFQSKLPAFHQFFGPQNWLLLGTALAATKVIHELGHGMSCKHFGGECHEIGIMILVLTPCLYCNVSDSWMLPSKWARAMIGAAGMYVELFLASICTFLWWYSEPGLLNSLCLSTMFVSSVSTIMFNANPLLRYDGYYILSDIAEIPNLRQKATKILTRKLGSWCLGLEEPEDPFLPKRNHFFFALYSVAAVIYRWFVMFSILYFLYTVFKPHRLEIIGQMIGMVSIFGLVVMPLWKVGKFFYVPGRIDKVKKPRMFISIAIILVVLAGILYIPFPFSVMCTAEIKPTDAESVNARVGGILHDVRVKPGQKVKKGDIIAILKNPDVEMSIQRVIRQQGDLESRIRTLQIEKNDDPKAIQQIRYAKISLKATKEERKILERERDRLTIRAERDGYVFPPPGQPARPASEGRLPSWTGTPLDPRNLHARIEAGQMLCQIGSDEKWHVELVIDQSDIEFVRRDQEVKIRLDELPMDNLETNIENIASEEMKYTPKNISNKSGGELKTTTDKAGFEKPQSTSYQASTKILSKDSARWMRVGLRGRGKISAGTKTLGDRFWRFVRQTFSFDL